MRNRMYGGVRGRKTKVGRKLLRFPPTRFPPFTNPRNTQKTRNYGSTEHTEDTKLRIHGTHGIPNKQRRAGNTTIKGGLKVQWFPWPRATPCGHHATHLSTSCKDKSKSGSTEDFFCSLKARNLWRKSLSKI